MATAITNEGIAFAQKPTIYRARHRRKGSQAKQRRRHMTPDRTRRSPRGSPGPASLAKQRPLPHSPPRFSPGLLATEHERFDYDPTTSQHHLHGNLLLTATSPDSHRTIFDPLDAAGNFSLSSPGAQQELSHCAPHSCNTVNPSALTLDHVSEPPNFDPLDHEPVVPLSLMPPRQVHGHTLSINHYTAAGPSTGQGNAGWPGYHDFGDSDSLESRRLMAQSRAQP